MIQQLADTQQFCEEEGFDVKFGKETYQFLHCANSNCKELVYLFIFMHAFTIII